MGYYAAGGYYRAGGFSLKKLGRFVGKVASNPMVQSLLGTVMPGTGPLLAGIQAFTRPSSPAATRAALGRSLPGTPGAVAYAARFRRRSALHRVRQPRVRQRAFTVA